MKTFFTISAFVIGGLVGWFISAHQYKAEIARSALLLSPEVQELAQNPAFRDVMNLSQEFALEYSPEEMKTFVREAANIGAKITQQIDAVRVYEAMLAVNVHRALNEAGTEGVYELLNDKILSLKQSVNDGQYDGTDLEQLAKATIEVGEKEIGSRTSAASGTR